MIEIYISDSQIQAKSNVFNNIGVTNDLSELNYFEKRKEIKSIAICKLKDRPRGAYLVFDYLLDHSNNETGISYHSQKRIADYVKHSREHVSRCLKILVEEGLIYKIRRGRRGRYSNNHTNVMMINYELINNTNSTNKNPPPKLKSYPYKPRKSAPSMDVISEITLSTNNDKKEVSINTNSSRFDFSKEKNEPDIPIPVTEFSARQVTRECVRVKLGHYSYDFIDECEKAFRMEPNQQSTLRMPDDWNRLFNKYCHESQRRKEALGQRWIPRSVRLSYHATKRIQAYETRTLECIPRDDDPPRSNAIIHPPVHKPDYRDYDPNDGTDEALEEFLRRHGALKPKPKELQTKNLN